MNELEEKIWKILGKAQTAALATISASGAPWVRYVTVRAEKNLSLNFCTGLSTRKAVEIAANPEVHLTCGNLQPPDDSVFLQIAGRAEIHADTVTKHQYWQEKWRCYFKGPDDPDYVMVFVHPYRIEYTGPDSFEPEVWQK
jgi:general stress protein 26